VHSSYGTDDGHEATAGALATAIRLDPGRRGLFVFVIDLSVEDHTVKIDSSAAPILLLELVSVA
jgi:hypothetical protein